jgi:hypothetical protein
MDIDFIFSIITNLIKYLVDLSGVWSLLKEIHIIPKNVTEKLSYNYKKIKFKIRNPSLNLKYTFKTIIQTTKEKPLQDYLQFIKSLKFTDDFSYDGEKQNSLLFSIKKQNYIIKYSISYTEEDVIDTVQLEPIKVSFESQLSLEYKYKQFDEIFIDFLTMHEEIEQKLHEKFGFWDRYSITFTLKRELLLSKFLSNANISELTGKINNLYDFQLNNNSIIIYSKINNEIKNPIKEIILYNY